MPTYTLTDRVAGIFPANAMPGGAVPTNGTKNVSIQLDNGGGGLTVAVDASDRSNQPGDVVAITVVTPG